MLSRLRVALLGVLGLAGCGPRPCVETLLSVRAHALGVEEPAIAEGATVELGFMQTVRLGCDGSLSSSGYYPLEARVADASVVEIVERRSHSVVVRGRRVGLTELVLTRHAGPVHLAVAVSAPVHASLSIPLAGVSDAAAVSVLVGSEVLIPVEQRDASGRVVVGGLEHPRGLVLRATAPGPTRVASLDAAMDLEVVGPEQVASLALDLQEEDTNIGYGCIPPAPALDAPVTSLYAGQSRLLLARGLTHDDRFVLGLPRPVSETPDVCTVRDAARPARLAEVVDFQLPASRGYQREGWELLAAATGTCRVTVAVGDTRAIVEVEVH